MKIKLSKSQWEEIGNKAGWIKMSQNLDKSKITENITKDLKDLKDATEQTDKQLEMKNKPINPSLNTDERKIFNPTEMMLKSKFPQIAPTVRDPKGKKAVYDMFDVLTDGNKVELNENVNKMKPIFKKFKEKEEALLNSKGNIK